MARYSVTVPFKDGTTKIIKFDANAFASIEQALGIESIIDYFSEPRLLRKRLGFTAIRTFIWAGVHGAGGNASVTEVGAQLDITKLPTYIEAIIDAFNLAATGKSSAQLKAEEDAKRKETEGNKVGGEVEEERPTAPNPGVGMT